jgi:hypothetical protein
MEADIEAEVSRVGEEEERYLRLRGCGAGGDSANRVRARQAATKNAGNRSVLDLCESGITLNIGPRPKSG